MSARWARKMEKIVIHTVSKTKTSDGEAVQYQSNISAPASREGEEGAGEVLGTYANIQYIS
jgi:hypothetical protein